MQHFESVIQYNAIILSVLLKEYYSYNLQFMVHITISSVILNTRVDYISSIVQDEKIH